MTLDCKQQWRHMACCHCWYEFTSTISKFGTGILSAAIYRLSVIIEVGMYTTKYGSTTMDSNWPFIELLFDGGGVDNLFRRCIPPVVLSRSPDQRHIMNEPTGIQSPDATPLCRTHNVHTCHESRVDDATSSCSDISYDSSDTWWMTRQRYSIWTATRQRMARSQ